MIYPLTSLKCPTTEGELTGSSHPGIEPNQMVE